MGVFVSSGDKSGHRNLLRLSVLHSPNSCSLTVPAPRSSPCAPAPPCSMPLSLHIFPSTPPHGPSPTPQHLRKLCFFSTITCRTELSGERGASTEEGEQFCTENQSSITSKGQAYGPRTRLGPAAGAEERERERERDRRGRVEEGRENRGKAGKQCLQPAPAAADGKHLLKIGNCNSFDRKAVV